MGADTGRCEAAGSRVRLVRLGPGDYHLAHLPAALVHRSSLEGSGSEETILEGPLYGPRAGSSLSRVTVAGSSGIGVFTFGGEVSDCIITGNSGGGVYCSRNTSSSILRSTISENSSSGVTCWGAATIEDCTISRNSTRWYGGGIGINAPTTLRRCRILDNFAGELGGGVYMQTWSAWTLPPVFEDLEVRGNVAGDARGSGGGGGLFLISRVSQLILSNCVIAGNLARTQGGGVYTRLTSPRFQNCTIASNSALETAGGLLFDAKSRQSPQPLLRNCIVWGNEGGSIGTENTIGPDHHVSPVVYYSCVGSDWTGTGTGVIKEDPLFVELGERESCDGSGEGCLPLEWDLSTGDPTRWARWIAGDLRLKPGSPCIDSAAGSGAPRVDIEGTPRPCGDGYDMGAYERCVDPAFLRGDCNDDGGVDISDAICALGWLFLGEGEPGCVAATNTNGDDGADLSDAVYLLGHLFLGGPAPVAPFPACGPGLLDADEVLGCETPPTSCP